MEILCLAVGVYTLILFVRVILSYVEMFVRPVPGWLLPIIRGTALVTEPVLRPLRRAVPPLRVGAAAVDLSILIVFLLLIPIREAVCAG